MKNKVETGQRDLQKKVDDLRKKVETGQEDLKKKVDGVQKNVNELHEKVDELLKKMDAKKATEPVRVSEPDLFSGGREFLEH